MISCGFPTRRSTCEYVIAIKYMYVWMTVIEWILQEALPLPDQIDEVVKYIESMQSKLENMRQKKESLLRRANLRTLESSLTTDHQPTSTRLVEVQDMGPNMDVILASGLADYSMFLDIIHNLLHRDGVEIASANFSVHGSSTIHVLLDKVIIKVEPFYGDENMFFLIQLCFM